MVLVGDEAQVEARFGPIGGRRKIGTRFCLEHATKSEIVLDAPDGTPR
jgi:hypothetical protein